MKTSCWLGALLLFAFPGMVGGQDKGLLAGGKGWKVVKSEEAPPGTRFLFTPDGKVAVTFVIDGKPREMTGTYTLAGNVLTLKLAHDGRERIDTRTIKKLTDSVLITEDKNRKLEELQPDAR
jgi:uncharacterized protein (TIGR03066 family)